MTPRSMTARRGCRLIVPAAETFASIGAVCRDGGPHVALPNKTSEGRIQ